MNMYLQTYLKISLTIVLLILLVGCVQQNVIGEQPTGDYDNDGYVFFYQSSASDLWIGQFSETSDGDLLFPINSKNTLDPFSEVRIIQKQGYKLPSTWVAYIEKVDDVGYIVLEEPGLIPEELLRSAELVYSDTGAKYSRKLFNSEFIQMYEQYINANPTEIEVQEVPSKVVNVLPFRRSVATDDVKSKILNQDKTEEKTFLIKYLRNKNYDATKSLTEENKPFFVTYNTFYKKINGAGLTLHKEVTDINNIDFFYDEERGGEFYFTAFSSAVKINNQLYQGYSEGSDIKITTGLEKNVKILSAYLIGGENKKLNIPGLGINLAGMSEYDHIKFSEEFSSFEVVPKGENFRITLEDKSSILINQGSPVQMEKTTRGYELQSQNFGYDEMGIRGKSDSKVIIDKEGKLFCQDCQSIFFPDTNLPLATGIKETYITKTTDPDYKPKSNEVRFIPQGDKYQIKGQGTFELPGYGKFENAGIDINSILSPILSPILSLGNAPVKVTAEVTLPPTPSIPEVARDSTTPSKTGEPVVELQSSIVEMIGENGEQIMIFTGQDDKEKIQKPEVKVNMAGVFNDFYEVKAGDTLSKIAANKFANEGRITSALNLKIQQGKLFKDAGLSKKEQAGILNYVRKIVETNNIPAPYTIRVGERIILPPTGGFAEVTLNEVLKFFLKNDRTKVSDSGAGGNLEIIRGRPKLGECGLGQKLRIDCDLNGCVRSCVSSDKII